MGTIPTRFFKESKNNHRIYVPFCCKDPNSNSDVSNWIECFNPSNKSWHRVTSIPGLPENHVLKGFSMVSIGDFIYIIGGRLCLKKRTRDDPPPDDDDGVAVEETDVGILQSVLKYDVYRDTWMKAAPMNVARFDFACTVCKNKIFIAGGQSTLGSAKGISSAEVYDPILDRWSFLPRMSSLRYKCVGVTYQGKVLVVGGFAEKDDSEIDSSPGPFNMERSSAEVFDCQMQRWDYKAMMWKLDIPPNQIVCVNNSLFSSGDCLNAWKGHLEVYDRNLNMWDIVKGSTLENLLYCPWRRLYLTMAPVGTHLYFLAGYKIPGEISRIRTEVHVFDTSENGFGWKSFEPIEEEGEEKEISCHSCVVQQDY
ncbi:OLC1v1024065C1 [Oldenlandia corymbosa var. corymbosa]|uniref:OLC1v1024065C1 n=1 Tax=Oldenlandia corymbosa var. corymbosa TaxID=529605 RepID=A0AAV1C2B2_OLDCO|nr:OLC1v1024065C1 [Oldenlandia corymbosa var. corymbosa]